MKIDRNERRGIALALAMIGIVVIGALIAGGFFMSMQEYRAGRNSLPQARSLSAAEYGQNETLRLWPTLGASSMAVGQTSAAYVYTTPSNGRANVRLSRLQQYLYSIVADGGAGNAVAGSDARKRTGLLVRLQVPVINMLGALTTRGSAKLGGSSFTDGNDYVPPGMTCGAAEPAKPGLVIPDEDMVTFSGCPGQSCLAGNPKIEEDPAAGEDDTYFDYGDVGWDELVANATINMPPGPWPGIGPIAVGAVCSTGVITNWGDPEFGGPCKSYFPVIYAPNGLQITGGFGQGILLVNGDLTVSGGARFYGPVIVKGYLRTEGTGGHFNGGVLAANVELDETSLLGNATVRFSSCAIANALMGSALPKRVTQRAWADLY
jgi:hypothetical protein